MNLWAVQVHFYCWHCEGALVYQFPGDNFETVSGESDSDFRDILVHSNGSIGLKQLDDPSDNQGISGWGRQVLPIVSPIIGPGMEDTSQHVAQPQSPALLEGPPVPSQMKKKNSVGKVWRKLKKLLVKKFWVGSQPVRQRA